MQQHLRRRRTAGLPGPRYSAKLAGQCVSVCLHYLENERRMNRLGPNCRAGLGCSKPMGLGEALTLGEKAMCRQTRSNVLWLWPWPLPEHCLTSSCQVFDFCLFLNPTRSRRHRRRTAPNLFDEIRDLVRYHTYTSRPDAFWHWHVVGGLLRHALASPCFVQPPGEKHACKDGRRQERLAPKDNFRTPSGRRMRGHTSGNLARRAPPCRASDESRCRR